jgi:DNA/RNA endonuclease G (NUC1)
MKKSKNFLWFIVMNLLIMSSVLSQNVVSKNGLMIDRGDIKLYLDDDTTSLISRHALKYIDFQKLGTVPRGDNWFDDTYKGKYLPVKYKKSGFDKGHLTPSHITTYDSITNRNSFSMFNAAPQYPYFNQHPWQELEASVEDSIKKYKSDAVIITGVIYNELKKTYIPKTRVKIPTHYFKIVTINLPTGTKTWCWIGSNVDDKKAKELHIKKECYKPTTLEELNNRFKVNGMKLSIK